MRLIVNEYDLMLYKLYDMFGKLSVHENEVGWVDMRPIDFSDAWNVSGAVECISEEP